jgi:hypothetical protein
LLEPKLLLHRHQRRVLGQAFRQHGGAAAVGADQLVRPPLVPDFVRGDVERVVDVLARFRSTLAMKPALPNRVSCPAPPAQGGVARELGDAQLAVLVGAELLGVVVQRGLGAA